MTKLFSSFPTKIAIVCWSVGKTPKTSTRTTSVFTTYKYHSCAPMTTADEINKPD
jgi:hypothetical protein